jgi:hypothetical protein
MMELFCTVEIFKHRIPPATEPEDRTAVAIATTTDLSGEVRDIRWAVIDGDYARMIAQANADDPEVRPFMPESARLTGWMFGCPHPRYLGSLDPFARALTAPPPGAGE